MLAQTRSYWIVVVSSGKFFLRIRNETSDEESDTLLREFPGHEQYRENMIDIIDIVYNIIRYILHLEEKIYYLSC